MARSGGARARAPGFRDIRRGRQGRLSAGGFVDDVAHCVFGAAATLIHVTTAHRRRDYAGLRRFPMGDKP
jgi:hypothetical protein